MAKTWSPRMRWTRISMDGPEEVAGKMQGIWREQAQQKRVWVVHHSPFQMAPWPCCAAGKAGPCCPTGRCAVLRCAALTLEVEHQQQALPQEGQAQEGLRGCGGERGSSNQSRTRWCAMPHVAGMQALQSRAPRQYVWLMCTRSSSRHKHPPGRCRPALRRSGPADQPGRWR